MWNPNVPEIALVANAISLLMPSLEPFIVGVVRRAVLERDPELEQAVDAYAAQELAHARHHRRYNEAVFARFPATRRMERVLRRAFLWMRNHGSQQFHLAFAAGAESLAYAAARWTAAHEAEVFRGSTTEVADLFRWHLAEEIEHKSAAFDLYDAAGGTRRQFAAGLLSALLILAAATLCGTLSMGFSTRRVFSPTFHWRLWKWMFSFVFSEFPNLAATMMAGHRPSQLVDPSVYPIWLAGFRARGNHPAQT
jgi:predicted metal-dependent hydrolase